MGYSICNIHTKNWLLTCGLVPSETVQGTIETVQGTIETVQGTIETVQVTIETVQGTIETVQGTIRNCIVFLIIDFSKDSRITKVEIVSFFSAMGKKDYTKNEIFRWGFLQ